MEIERQKIEIENAERISYNEKLLKNIKRKYKKDAIIKFLLLSLLNLFLSVAAFQIGFYTFTSTNYNDKQAENKGFIVGLIVGLSVFFILSIINLIKRIKECESPEDCGMYIPKKIIDTSKYSKENIDKFYLEKLNTATIELDALRRKRDKAAKMPINVANSFLVIQLNVFKENVDIAENCLNTLIKDSGIYKDYTSFVCICQFIQYLESGRCSSLEGPYGCYNLFETELRAHLIISELSEIRYSLDRIERSMSNLLDAVNAISKNTEAILGEVKNIRTEVNYSVKNHEEDAKKLSYIGRNTSLIAACNAFNCSNKMPRGMAIKMINDAFSNYASFEIK